MKKRDVLARAAVLSLMLHGVSAFCADTVTGRPVPALPESAEAKPSLTPLLDCDAEADRESRERATTKMGPLSAQGRAQFKHECELRNSRYAESNAAETARVARMNAARTAEITKAKEQLATDRAVFDAEEEQVRQLVARWKSRIRPDRPPAPLAMLADNAHMLVKQQVVGPFRLIERLDATSAIATTGRAVVKVERIPADVALFSDRSFVLIAEVAGTSSVETVLGRKVNVPLLLWTDGGDCALQATPAHRRGAGCLPWLGLRKALHIEQ